VASLPRVEGGDRRAARPQSWVAAALLEAGVMAAGGAWRAVRPRGWAAAALMPAME
jgi:hypothetical protein